MEPQWVRFLPKSGRINLVFQLASAAVSRMPPHDYAMEFQQYQMTRRCNLYRSLVTSGMDDGVTPAVLPS